MMYIFIKIFFIDYVHCTDSIDIDCWGSLGCIEMLGLCLNGSDPIKLIEYSLYSKHYTIRPHMPSG